MKEIFKIKRRILILIGVLYSMVGGLGYGNDNYPAVFNLSTLNGQNGVFVNGVPWYNSGGPVAGGGDFNGDGIADFLIGSYSNTDGNAVQIYVVFGNKGGWPQNFSLVSLNGQNGCVINGSVTNASISISNAGDVNGDGIDDIIIGAPEMNNNTGQSYIVFGNKKWAGSLNLTDLNGSNGCVINGINPIDQSGWSVSNAGDVNRDGIDDVIIGAPGANNGTGQAYVIFGNKATWPGIFNLVNLNGTNGFIINGINEHEFCGWSVSGGMDVNGDGISDIFIGAPGAINSVGRSYLIFGSRAPWPAVFNTINLNGLNGFYVIGINIREFSGYCVSLGGDVNGDGYSDMLIGAPAIHNNSGQSYVLFGGNLTWPAGINATNLNGQNGFIIIGITDDRSGQLISGVGDFNGDKIADFIVGAPAVNNNTGESSLFFGSKGPWPAMIVRTALNGSTGFLINGSNNTGDYSVYGVGDVNGDNLGDILFGSQSVNLSTGQSYLVFGYRLQEENDYSGLYIFEAVVLGSSVTACVTSFAFLAYYGYQYRQIMGKGGVVEDLN